MNQSKKMASIVYNALSDKKGQDVTIIDISEVSCLADYFIIANGENSNQVQAMIDNVEEEMDKAGYQCSQREGYQAAKWILLDYKDVVVHVFSKEDRRFYDLERIWRDGKFITEKELAL
ncbi:ribosome silencing factor [Qiania dongpingensis]|uniref:Ribosomal silencing factor RsfS n=1 Tax=Qiania dongpingensis TaxID=2763669 RepID=A0A7G9G4R3_9FIRM|nr:ribosome silencing factor [Qiania dongpingensis]QNM05795.1 ribosome silencing factor [Qiania dongpingensis]